MKQLHIALTMEVVSQVMNRYYARQYMAESSQSTTMLLHYLSQELMVEKSMLRDVVALNNESILLSDQSIGLLLQAAER